MMAFAREWKSQYTFTDETYITYYFNPAGREIGQSVSTATAMATTKTTNTHIPHPIRELVLAYYLDNHSFLALKKQSSQELNAPDNTYAFFNHNDINRLRHLLVTKLLKHVVQGEKEEAEDILKN